MKKALIACAIAIGSVGLLPIASARPTARPRLLNQNPNSLHGQPDDLPATTGSAVSRRPTIKPAFQGGFDFAHKSGFYLGNWNSNVSSSLFNGAPHRDGLLRRLQARVWRLRARRWRHLLLLPGHRRARPLQSRRTSRRTSVGRMAPCRPSTTTPSPTSSASKRRRYDTKGSQYFDCTGTFPLEAASPSWRTPAFSTSRTTKHQSAPWSKTTYLDYKLGVYLRHHGIGLDPRRLRVGTSEKSFFLTAESPAGQRRQERIPGNA